MKLYKASKENCDNIIGTQSYISRKLNVSRQFVNKSVKNNTLCIGYSIQFYINSKPKIKLTTKERLSISLSLLKRARLIIDENNEKLSNNNEYANINIISDIDRFIKNYP